MRIIKYLFIMLILFCIGLAVYIATQNASFKVNGSKFIPVSKNIVYNYIADLKNWEAFASWNSKNTNYTFSKKTNTLESKINWIGSNAGSLETTFLNQNDSIEHKLVLNNQNSQVQWKFKDTIGGTIINWKTKGKLDFKTKVIAFFKGGVNYSASNVFTKTLENIDKNLIYELKTFTTKVIGVVKRDTTYYIKTSILTREKNINKNITLLFPVVQKYFDDNKLTNNGNQFIMYNKLDKINDIINISVCIPVKDSLNIMPGGKIESGFLPGYSAVKTTLTGDYSHLKKAWDDGYKYIIKNKLINNFNIKVIEVYTITAKEVKNQSKFVTEVYLPILQKTPQKIKIRKPKDSLQNQTTPIVEPVIEP